MIKYIYALLAMISLLSCRKIDRESFVPETPKLSTDSEMMTVANGSSTIEINVESNLPWRMISNTSWITIVEGSGLKSGKAKVTIAKNALLENRIGTLTLYIDDSTKQIITITQDAGLPVPVVVNEFYVKTTGSETNDGLSWNNATTLHKALSISDEGDIIHVAAGVYVPSTPVTGGAAADISFEISKNVKIIGGYPANATSGSVATPETNKTILSGNSMAYHVMLICASKIPDLKVSINGVTVTKGNASATASSLTINGITFARNYAGGIIIGKSTVELNNCIVSENNSNANCGGIYMKDDAILTLNSSKVVTNTVTGNGGGIWNDGSTLYLFNSEISNNTATGVAGGVYAIHSGTKPTYNYIYNSTIAQNHTNTNSTAVYARKNSIFYIVNSTIYGNTSNGTAAGLRTNEASSEINLINSTVANNIGGTGTSGNGLTSTASRPINVYNSIVVNNGDIQSSGADIKFLSSILGSDIFDYNGNKLVTSVDPTNLIKPFANYGALGASAPLLTNNSAAHINGMTNLQLEILFNNLNLNKSYYLIDQNSKSRVSKSAMGAAIE
jgi:hypothetical protein